MRGPLLPNGVPRGTLPAHAPHAFARAGGRVVRWDGHGARPGVLPGSPGAVRPVELGAVGRLPGAADSRATGIRPRSGLVGRPHLTRRLASRARRGGGWRGL